MKCFWVVSLFWSLKCESMLVLKMKEKPLHENAFPNLWLLSACTSTLHIAFSGFCFTTVTWTFNSEARCDPQTLFQYVTSLMKQGYHEESERQRHLAASPRERPDKRSTALWVAVRPSVRPPRQQQPRTVSLFPRRNVTLYILYLLSPFVSRCCSCQLMIQTSSRDGKKK